MRQVIGKGMLATAAATSILSLSGSNAFAAGGDAVAADSPGILSGNSVQAPLDVPVNACGNSANAVGVGNPAMGNSCANSGSAPQQHAGTPHRASSQAHAATRNDGHGYGDTSEGENHAPTYPGTHAGTQSLAQSDATNSPGILSGNNVQTPADVPVNACGNTVDVVGLLNPATGNGCANGAPAPTSPGHETPASPETPSSPETPPRAAQPPADRAMPPEQTDRSRDDASSTSRQITSAAHEAPNAVARLAETGGDQDLLAAAAASAALLVGGGILYRRGFASSGR